MPFNILLAPELQGLWLQTFLLKIGSCDEWGKSKKKPMSNNMGQATRWIR